MYYSTSNFSDTSFYEPYDPFEYLTAEVDRHDKSEEEDDDNKSVASIRSSSTPKRPQIRKVGLLLMGCISC